MGLIKGMEGISLLNFKQEIVVKINARNIFFINYDIFKLMLECNKNVF